MAFSVIPGLAADDIEIQLPAQKDTDWAINLRDLAFKKIAQHDHSGSGNGQPLTGNSLSNNSVIGAKILLENDEYLRWKNTSAVATNVMKLAADNKIEIEQQIDKLIMGNNVYIQGRNQADSADIDIVRVNGGDRLEFGAEIAAAKLKQDTYLTGRNAADSADINVAKVDSQDRVLLQDSLYVKGTATLADNTSSATNVPNLPTCSTDESIKLFYKIVRNGAVETGELEFDEDNANLVQVVSGDDVGVTFSNSAGTLQYVTTNTGNAATLTYTAIKA
jgi:hypothetical protein